MITEIKKGDRFRCVNPDHSGLFTKDATYNAFDNNTIENDSGLSEIEIEDARCRKNFNRDFIKIESDPDTQQDLTREAIEQNEVESVMSRQFDTGSKRDNDDNKPLPMEMNPYMLMRYGYHMKYGQVRYGDGNWELQQPDSEVWRSMSRHFTQAYMNFRFPDQAKATDDGTDHLSAIMFGINMLMHNECVNGVEADMYFKRRNK